jgi:FlgD Ig-like domain
MSSLILPKYVTSFIAFFVFCFLANADPQIYLPEGSHEFITSPGNSDSWMMEVQNTGDETLIISSVQLLSTYYYFSINATFPIEIEPGGNDFMEVVFTAPDLGDFPGFFQIISNSQNNGGLKVDILGHGVYQGANLVALNSEVDCGEARVGACKSGLLTLQNQGDSEILMDGFGFLDSHFRISNLYNFPIVLDPLETHSLLFWFEPDEEGIYEDSLSFYCNSNPVALKFPIRGEGIRPYFDLGTPLWNRQLDYVTRYLPMNDINADGWNDFVLVSSYRDSLVCINVNSTIDGDIIWRSGINDSVDFSESGTMRVKAIDDANNDGYHDILFLFDEDFYIAALFSGKNGNMLQLDTIGENPHSAHISKINTTTDFNMDGHPDVLFGDIYYSGTLGTRPIQCYDYINSQVIWQSEVDLVVRSLTVFQDVNEDAYPEVLAWGKQMNGDFGRVVLLNGLDGSLLKMCDFDTANLRSLTLIDDITNDGFGEIVLTDFMYQMFFFDIIEDKILIQSMQERFAIDAFDCQVDINKDGYRDLVPRSFWADTLYAVDGFNGSFIWKRKNTYPDGITCFLDDLNFDEIPEIVLGYAAYDVHSIEFLDGATGQRIKSGLGFAGIWGIYPIGDINQDYKTDFVTIGGSNKIYCQSGGKHLYAFENENPARDNFLQCSPNPFSETMELSFHLVKASWVLMQVLDMNGRHVLDLFNGSLPAGQQSIRWDGKDNKGLTVPDGIYFIRLIEGKESHSVKVLKF